MRDSLIHCILKGCLLLGLLHVLPSVESHLLAGEKKAPSANELHRILSQLEALRDAQRKNLREELFSEVGKCGLRVSFDVISIWQYLSHEQQSRVMLLLQPLQLQKDTVIGRFRIHYDTTGFNEPALLNNNNERIPGTARAYVDSVGRFFNEVWSYEIDSLGYTAPPVQTDDQYYNVYVEDLGNFLYGETKSFPEPINPGHTPPRYASYIRIDNDYQPFFSKGMQGLKVTAAHEFHHVIQLGSYGYWENDIYFYEITSTWMEDVVYDDVNDYYQYLKYTDGRPRGHFARPDLSLTFFCYSCPNFDVPYSRAIWGKYIEKRFSRNVVRRIWEYMREVPSLPAIDLALHEIGSSLRKSYVEFSIWNYFTADRADIVKFYSEGHNYPLVKLKRDSLQFVAPSSVFFDNLGIEGLGTAYYRVFLNPRGTIFVIPIISNINIDSAGNGYANSFQYHITSVAPIESSYTRFIVGDSLSYWAKVEGVTNPMEWKLLHAIDGIVIGDSVIYGDKPIFKPVIEVLVYPNPFYIHEHDLFYFRIPRINEPSVSLYIYSSDLSLVFYSEIQAPRPTLTKPTEVTWNGKKQNGEYTSTGIYFYVIIAGDQQYTGKFTLIRK